MVKQWYIRLRVEIAVDFPLPGGFFKKRKKEGDEEIRIQFKLERLYDFCYKCSLLTHVSGQNSYATPARITSANGISAKLFKPWFIKKFKSPSTVVSKTCLFSVHDCGTTLKYIFRP